MPTPDRQLPKDDRELEQMAGIAPADHQFTVASPATIAGLERMMLGPDWFGRRKRELVRDPDSGAGDPADHLRG